MVALTSPVCNVNTPALDFSLPGTDGKIWTLADCRGEQGLVVMFICNHCPYVKAIRERLIQDARELKAYGVQCVAISSNDAYLYPEDSFENMVKLALQLDLPFPYLYDESQRIAKAYGAVCTPDFFGYNRDLKLQYRGRLDDAGNQTHPTQVKRELFLALKQIATTGLGPEEQLASIGCSIKWKS
jgi:peroxiredoxin